ncbi:MAG: 2-oxoacid:acceptor oxidoreductase family protein [Candidatus Lokiarchaeota archaeon]|nr:2-oxoacid:acceptor oxidoreductase family protein [Candidatus Lokiarchaeota archaeon]
MKFNETDIINVVIAGTAGQGVITLKRLIEFAAQKAGVEICFGAEQHGLAQREGAIISHTRYQKRLTGNPRYNLQSSLICFGDADLYICIEPVESLRRGIFASSKTSFVINERDIPNILVAADMEKYPPLEKIKEILSVYSDQVFFMNATELSLNNFDSNQQVNLIMLGFAIMTEKLPFIEVDHYEEVIKEWLRDPDLNIKALHLGMEKGKEIIN